MASSKPKTTAGVATRGLQVIAKRASFFRAGIEFGHEPRLVALSELTPEQHEAITTEPMLVCQEIDMPAADAASA